MNVVETTLPGVLILEPRVFGDDRGFFLESWNADTFRKVGLDASFVQDNHSRSARGTLRGLHYQTRHAQGKLVRVTVGEVFDIAVDLRTSSPTFGQWFGALLSASNHRMMWVPEGFAHGFYVLSDSADFQYKCTDIYDPQSEVCIAWDDPELAIDWPIPEGEEPLLSSKDTQGLAFADAPRFD